MQPGADAGGGVAVEQHRLAQLGHALGSVSHTCPVPDRAGGRDVGAGVSVQDSADPGDRSSVALLGALLRGDARRADHLDGVVGEVLRLVVVELAGAVLGARRDARTFPSDDYAFA